MYNIFPHATQNTDFNTTFYPPVQMFSLILKSPFFYPFIRPPTNIPPIFVTGIALYIPITEYILKNGFNVNKESNRVIQFSSKYDHKSKYQEKCPWYDLQDVRGKCHFECGSFHHGYLKLSNIIGGGGGFKTARML